MAVFSHPAGRQNEGPVRRNKKNGRIAVVIYFSGTVRQNMLDRLLGQVWFIEDLGMQCSKKNHRQGGWENCFSIGTGNVTMPDAAMGRQDVGLAEMGSTEGTPAEKTGFEQAGLDVYGRRGIQNGRRALKRYIDNKTFS